MADDGPRGSDGATDVTFRDLHAVDVRIVEMIQGTDKRLIEKVDAVDKRLAERVDSVSNIGDQRASFSERAIDKASSAMEKRLDGMNEFRKSLEDARKDSISRTEFDQWKVIITEQINRLENRSSGWDGGAKMLVIILTGFASVAGLILYALNILKK